MLDPNEAPCGFIAIAETGCDGCDMFADGCRVSPACESYARKDKTTVIFKRIKSMPTISMDKQYRYQDETPARILAVDLPGEYPVVSVCPLGEIYRHKENGMAPFSNHLNLVEITPYSDFVRGEPVITDDGSRRYFSHVGVDGLPRCFANGATAWSSVSSAATCTWANVRRPTKEELEEQGGQCDQR